jgi:hypothetical protein
MTAHRLIRGRYIAVGDPEWQALAPLPGAAPASSGGSTHLTSGAVEGPPGLQFLYDVDLRQNS